MRTFFAATLFALCPSAFADDPEFQQTEKTAEKVEAAETHVSAELGGTFASGNSVFYAVNGGLAASHKWKMNKLAATAGINLGQAIADSDGDGRLSEIERTLGYSKNAERFFAEGRYDRFLTDTDSLYLLAGGFKDIFAGYDLRTHEQFGYSRQLVKNDATTLFAELGVDWAQENYVDSVDPNYADVIAARVMLGLTHQFNESVSFADTVEIYQNIVDFDDTRVLNTATLSSSLNSNLSLKVSHSLIFDSQPVENFETLDQTTMLTLVATLL